MGCSSSREPSFKKTNLWGPHQRVSQNKSCHLSRTVKKRVLFPGARQRKIWSLDQIPDVVVKEDPIRNQKKIEQLWKNQKIEQLDSRDLAASGSFSEAIALLEFGDISHLGTSSSSICLKEINEGSQEVPIRFKPDITEQSQRKAPYHCDADTNCQRKQNTLTNYAIMNRAWTCNTLCGRVLIRENAEHQSCALQQRETNCNDRQKKIVRTNVISGYTCRPYMSSENCRLAKNSPGGRKFLRGYQTLNDLIKNNDSAYRSMKNTIQNYGKVFKGLECDSTSFGNTVLEYDSSTETDSYELEETMDLYKTSRRTEENSEYLENKFSTVPSTSSSLYPQRKTLSKQKLRSPPLFLRTIQC